MCDEHGADIVMDSSPDLRRTRFVCVSDTHNASPSNGSFKLPKGDVLIHAGDLTNQGSISELRKTIEWIKKADFEIKIVVAGAPSSVGYADTSAYFSQAITTLVLTPISMLNMVPTSTTRTRKALPTALEC